MRGRDQSGSKSRPENRSSSRRYRFLEHIEFSDRRDLRVDERNIIMINKASFHKIKILLFILSYIYILNIIYYLLIYLLNRLEIDHINTI